MIFIVSSAVIRQQHPTRAANEVSDYASPHIRRGIILPFDVNHVWQYYSVVCAICIGICLRTDHPIMRGDVPVSLAFWFGVQLTPGTLNLPEEWGPFAAAILHSGLQRLTCKALHYIWVLANFVKGEHSQRSQSSVQSNSDTCPDSIWLCCMLAREYVDCCARSVWAYILFTNVRCGRMWVNWGKNRKGLFRFQYSLPKLILCRELLNQRWTWNNRASPLNRNKLMKMLCIFKSD